MAGLSNIYTDSRNLPHYTSRREAGIGKEEPFYKNLFLVTIIAPPSIASGGDLLSAQCTKIAGINLSPDVGEVTQSYRGATRSYAGAALSQTHYDLTLDFNLNLNENNQLYIYKILKAWKNLIHDPFSGRRDIKVNYAGSIIADIYNRHGDVYMRVTFGDAWPSTSIMSFDLDFAATDLHNLSGIKFRADYAVEELL